MWRLLGGLETVVLMRAADFIVPYCISAASGYKFMWEMSKKNREGKLLFLMLTRTQDVCIVRLCTIVALPLVSPNISSFSGARRQRKALEASISGLDRERPLNIWEHATDEGSLVQPSAYISPPSHQVPVLFYFSLFKSIGNGWISQDQV